MLSLSNRLSVRLVADGLGLNGPAFNVPVSATCSLERHEGPAPHFYKLSRLEGRLPAERTEGFMGYGLFYGVVFRSSDADRIGVGGGGYSSINSVANSL